MTATIIDGRKIAQEIRSRVTKDIDQFRSHNKNIPQITTITVGADPSAELYRKLRDAACREAGILSQQVAFQEQVEESLVLKTIYQMNIHHSIHGILIQFPLPKHLQPDRLLAAIDPKKDVEGLHPTNLGRTLLGDEFLVPCTPLAVLTILEHEQVNLKGKDIVVVNHSTVVGKPLAALLLNRNATVSVCHVFTKDLKRYTASADILISAAGVPKLITADFVKDGAIVIDVGITQTKDGICGDVDAQSVKEKAKALTPVPGGVGPVTIACSLQNMVKTITQCMGKS